MVDLRGHEAGNGGYSQRKPTAHRDSSTRKVVQWPDFDSYSFFCFLKSSSIIAGGAEIDPCATTIQVSLSTFKQQNSQGTGGKLSGGPLRESSCGPLFPIFKWPAQW